MRWWGSPRGLRLVPSGSGVDELVAEDDGGCAAAGFDVGGVVDTTDDAAAGVVVGACEDLGVLFRDLGEGVGVEEAGIEALFVGFADWVEGGVEVVGAGTSRRTDALRNILADMLNVCNAGM